MSGPREIRETPDSREGGDGRGLLGRWPRRFAIWAAVTLLDLFLIAAAIAFYAFVWEPNHVVIERVTLERDSRSGRTGRLRIAQVSDLDLRRAPGYRENRARKLIAAMKPDLVVFSGDLIGDVPRGRAVALMKSGVEWLASLPSAKGTFLVLGEEEEPLRDELQRMLPPNVHLVQDDWVRLQTGGLETLVCGPNGHAPQVHAAPSAPGGPALLVGEGASRRRVVYRGAGAGDRPLEAAGDSAAIPAKPADAAAPAAPATGPATWENYELSGRLMMKRPGDAFGLVVYAGGTESEPSGYEFSKMQGESGFKLRSEAEKLTGDHKGATGIVEVNVWHRFRLQAQSGAQATRVRSKFWRDGAAEPGEWQGEMEDRSPQRARSGSIAVVTGGWECGREKYLDDLEVRMRAEGKAAAPRTVFADDFGDPARFRDEWSGGGPPWEKADFVLMIAHSPDIVRGLHYSRGVDLILAGHTHGGQAVLPLFGPVESNLIVDPKLYTGTHELGGVTLHVNRGIGTAVVPARVACPPEVTRVDVQVGAGGAAPAP